MKNHLLDEIHRVRDAIMAECDYDLNKLGLLLKKERERLKSFPAAQAPATPRRNPKKKPASQPVSKAKKPVAPSLAKSRR